MGSFCRWMALCALLALIQAPALAASREKMDVALLLDNSGSMHREGATPGNDERFMRVAAVQYLLEKLAPGDRVALVTFDSVVHEDPRASRLLDVTKPGAKAGFYQAARRIAGHPDNSTNMAAGLRAAARILGPEDPDRQRFLILLTDGTPNPPHGANAPDQIVRYAGHLGRQGIVIHTVGLGALSDNPAEAAAAQKLLEAIAQAGHGAAHRAVRADDLPPLFGSIFAQLAGHEVSRFVPPGHTVSFTLAPGTQNLRVVATSEGEAPQFSLTDPHGRPCAAHAIPPLLPPAETARLAVAAVDAPPPGSWKVVSTRGALEVAYEPSFEAVLISPPDHSVIPSQTPVPFVVEVRRKGQTAPLKLARGRVVVEYERRPGASFITVPLVESPGAPGRFSGTLPNCGDVGPHSLRVRCFRAGDAGEEEGGPAYATLEARRLPVLAIRSPAPGASFALPAPIPVHAALTLAGSRLSSPPPGVQVQAWICGRSVRLAPAVDGSYAGSVAPGARPGRALLRVALSGRFDGAPLPPQTVAIPVTLAPHPLVSLRWDASPPIAANPNDTITLTARVSSSAPSPQRVRLALAGAPGLAALPTTLAVAAHQPEQAVPVHLRWSGLRPGDFTLAVTPRIDPGGSDLRARPFTARVHVRSWLERNRWWLYPALAISALLALLAAAFTSWWLREEARRRRKMLDALNGASVYIVHRADPIMPPCQKVLARRSYSFGGPGSDVLITDPQQPGRPLFKEPRLRIVVEWDGRHHRPQLTVKPEGTDTMLYDSAGKLIEGGLSATQGGVQFRIDPEHEMVKVSSQWAG